MPQQITPGPEKDCEQCGTPLERKRFNGRLEDLGAFKRRRFCSLRCAGTKTEVTMDALHWRARRHRASACQQCGTATDLHVHHIDRDPANNDPANLMTLCSSCHLKLHWREDRESRMATARALRRPDQKCVVCGRTHHPRQARTQTCSPSCKAALLSRRTTEHYQAK